MDVIDLIFQLLHIFNLPSLVILTPPHSPYTPSIDYVHFFVNRVNSYVDCDNTSTNYTDFFTDCGNTYVNYSNTPKDWVNIIVDSTETLEISSLDI
jgi:hypothetical protein